MLFFYGIIIKGIDLSIDRNEEASDAKYASRDAVRVSPGLK